MKAFKLLAVAAAAAVLATPSFAEGLSFNIGVVSLYKSKGIDQDSRQEEDRKGFRPALQGGVDYDFGNGFYIGNWNSTGKFGDANVEIDLYGGYTGEITDMLSYDVGVVRYIYPGNNDEWNGNDVYASVTYGIVTAKVERGVSGSIKKHERFSLAVSQPLSDALTLDAVMGFRNTSNDNSGANDYGIGLTYDLGKGLSANALLSGAQRSKAGEGGKNRLVLGVSQSF
jgi:uncharacterized protein (TIGR02001 family)